ncbi:helix-turn-helix domain-containing protein [Phyllobacterium sp. P30BS-XVII]|uniref:MarR family winged helix-turn-helix transcriptional regulator n=1 Tax=Phyllobacterium sp. P30BS-XVII TaxID=2587046 RepID=UPI000DDEC341|nr:helix-turn-helix domain-containing protein [Phyllobacterium sp. P30BS-XVII]MBA8903120.1 DNA-binding MarR family transcriptional regulator [Phyllobacterium sp. P30BS-XVII]
MSDDVTQRRPQLDDDDYAALAQFRKSIREFLSFSEEAAKRSGVTPQQHQAILAIRGTSDEKGFSVGDLAAHLMIQHHSAVELANRLASAYLVEKTVDSGDRRRINLNLTHRAHELLEELSWAHVSELKRRGPELATALNKLNPENR